MTSFLRSILLIALTLGTGYQACAAVVLPPDSTLRRMAAQMLMVGFTGNEVNEQSDAARYVRDLHVGAIILFDVDLTGKATIGSRNITSVKQIKRLTTQLRQWATAPLIIALDQEGGRVARLKPQYGFHPTVSARYLGRIDNADTTRRYAASIANDLALAGVDVNLAPVLDIHNPQGPGLGKLDRCFSSHPEVIARNAAWFIDEHHRRGVLCAAKHFPGHGSAMGDSHWGYVEGRGITPFPTTH